MGIFKRGSVWYARWFEDGRVRRRSLRIGDRREAEGRFCDRARGVLPGGEGRAVLELVTHP